MDDEGRVSCEEADSGRRSPSGAQGSGTVGPFLAYNGVLAAASPLLLGWYAWRVLGGGKSREGWLERLGWPSQRQQGIPSGQNIWLHAVSVGEVAAAAPVINEYRQIPEAFEVELSTITSSGKRMASKLLPDTRTFFLPVDILPSVRSVVRRIRPRCLALCEVELWPNLIHFAKSSGSGVVLVNGRMSDSTVEKADRFGWIYRWALGNMDRFLMQSDQDAERVIRLGADERKVEVAGNTKFDEAEEPLDEEQRRSVATSCGLDVSMPVFVAGSVNPGEEAAVLGAFSAGRKVDAELKLILAPRQIERADEIAGMISDAGFTSIKRSDVDGPHSADVVILNTFGELAKVYALGRVAFVGGTFIDKGGHNILQPLEQGVPVAFGPYDYKIRDISARALEAGVAVKAGNPEYLAKAVADMVRQAADGRFREDALSFVRANKGASRRCALVIHQVANAAREQAH